MAAGMTLSCRCDMIEEQSIRPGYCRFCGGRIDPEWVSSDATFAEFFDQLAELPGVPSDLIEQCRDRELAGRETFGFAYLARDNPKEAREEIADFVLYIRLHLLCARREGRPEKVEAALRAAHHAALAYEITREL